MKNIDHQLSQADPLSHVTLHELPEAAVKALAQEIVMREQTPAPTIIETPTEISATRPPRRRRRLVLGLIAGLIVVPTTAAAVAGGMHTGLFGPPAQPGYTPMNEPGEEFYNSNSPEISSVVKALTKEFPLPSGASYNLLLKRYPTKENTYLQRTNLAQDVSSYAQCKWYQHWLTGDSAQRAADQPTIDAMPTWKYWRFATDDTTGDNPGLEILKTIAAETRVGKTTTITQYVRANCG